VVVICGAMYRIKHTEIILALKTIGRKAIRMEGLQFYQQKFDVQ
jgi:hypothetical protein